AHAELMSCLRRHFNVRDNAIGFAGMKDKVGITRQTVSIHVLDDPPSVELDHRRIKVLWGQRHRNKIRLGHLAGNRFSIRIRDVEPTKAPLALRTLQRLGQFGVPNYFGLQRFGYRCNNHLIGAAMLAGEWDDMVENLLGAGDGNFPEYQRQRRELFDAGDYARAAEQWTAADRSERIICSRLAAGKSPREACHAVGETALAFWISALQSAMFNRVLDRRLQEGTLATLREGDLAWKHATRGIFLVTAQEMATGELPGRLTAMEISPSGPLWGTGMMQAAGATSLVEREALQATGLTMESIIGGPHSPTGARRPLRCPLNHPELDAGIDEHGKYIRVAFDLPRGAYATIALREIMKNDHVEPDEPTHE
ncbi:MAG: tRNA pseudouridine(13) synthase TruD, partial [Phycisphaerales bacterium]|nr:tRNA pseudouridine(13) synthase TruD [Phycisphaerales bacterium]